MSTQPTLETALHDATFARKLALALLGVLQDKGVLSEDEVDAVLLAARRSAEADTTEFYRESRDVPEIDLEM